MAGSQLRAARNQALGITGKNCRRRPSLLGILPSSIGLGRFSASMAWHSHC
jgi:hypothetical protein